MATITVTVTGQRFSPRVRRRQAGRQKSSPSTSACSPRVTRAYHTGLRTRGGSGGAPGAPGHGGPSGTPGRGAGGGSVILPFFTLFTAGGEARPGGGPA